jgi:hypothetical protein
VVLQDLNTSADIGQGHGYLFVKAARSDECPKCKCDWDQHESVRQDLYKLVQHFWEVSGTDDNDTL